MTFEHPRNGYKVDGWTNISWLWVILFCPLYYLVKGIWQHALLSALLSVPISYLGAALFGYTFLVLFGNLGGIIGFVLGSCIVGIVYANFNIDIIRHHYLSQGWREVNFREKYNIPSS